MKVNIDEVEAFKSLLDQVPKDKYERIVTIGRGGLSIAQVLGYALDILVVQVQSEWDLDDLTAKDLFVDDICCTGRTLSKIGPLTDTATLVTRMSANPRPEYTGKWFGGDEYIQFSWEGPIDE